MIQFKHTDEINIDVLSNGNFLGEICYHKVKGWCFLDFEVNPYTFFTDIDLDFLKHEVIEYYNRVLTKEP